jgi:hypothetical protein
MAMLGRSEHRLFRGGEPPLPLAATESKSRQALRLLSGIFTVVISSSDPSLPSNHSDP